MTTFQYGTRVRSVSEGPLGVLDPDAMRPAFQEDVYVLPGDTGTVIASNETMPEGWLLVDFDGKGRAPVHPNMVEPA
jgi:hypothetical protein